MILNRNWHKTSPFTVRVIWCRVICTNRLLKVRAISKLCQVIKGHASQNLLSRMRIHCEFFPLNPVSISLIATAAVASFVLPLRGVSLSFYINGHYEPGERQHFNPSLSLLFTTTTKSQILLLNFMLQPPNHLSSPLSHLLHSVIFYSS